MGMAGKPGKVDTLKLGQLVAVGQTLYGLVLSTGAVYVYDAAQEGWAPLAMTRVPEGTAIDQGVGSAGPI